MEKYYSPDREKIQNLAKQNKLSSGARLTLDYLVARLGHKDNCWPSQKAIAEVMYKSERQVRNYLKELKDKNIITWEHGGDGVNKVGEVYHHKSNHYYLGNVLKDITNMFAKNKSNRNENTDDVTADRSIDSSTI
jgi:hypothetical protein